MLKVDFRNFEFNPMQNLFDLVEACTRIYKPKTVQEDSSEEDESSSSNVNESEGNNTQYTIAYTFEMAIGL